MNPAILVALLLWAVATPAPTCPLRSAKVLPEGTIEIDGKRYADVGTLSAGLKRLSCNGKEAEVVLDPRSFAKYQDLAKALSMFQKAGGAKVGFVNIQQDRKTK